MMKTDNEMKDPQIAYWANLCEGASENIADSTMNEGLDAPYSWDIEIDKPISTVKDLKLILANFNDNDLIEMLGPGDESFEIKAVWNSAEEEAIVGDGLGTPENRCYIRIAE